MLRSSLLIFTILACVSCISASSVPLFMYSNKEVFSGHVSVKESLTHDSYSTLVKSLLKPSAAHSSYVKPQPAPEVVIAVVYPKLGSAEASQLMGVYGSASSSNAALSTLQSTLSSSSSSLVAPYLYDVDASVSLLSVAQSVSANVRAVNMAQLMSAVDDASLFSNGVTDLLVVQASDLHEDLVLQLSSKLQAKAGNAGYVVMVTAQQPSTQVKMTRTSPSLHSHSFLQIQASSLNAAAKNTTGPQYITPSILIGVIIGWMLIFILYIGVTCLASVEKPIRLSRIPLQISKEY